MYGISEKLFIAGLIVLFITVVLGGMYGVQLARMYLRCRAMEREYDLERREREKYDRWMKERASWNGMVADREDRIKELTDELIQATKECEIAKNTLAKFNIRGELIDDTARV